MAVFSAAIAFVAPYVATGLGVSLATATAITQIGVSLAISSITRRNAPRLPPQEVQAVINQSTSPRRRSYGRVKLGGVRVFFEAKGGILHQVIAHHEGAVSSVIGHVVDGEFVEMNETGIIIESDFDFEDRVRIRWKNGTGASFIQLTDAFGDLWTANHLMQGSLVSHVRFIKPAPERLNAIFPKGANTPVQVIVNGVEVFDPRVNNTAYSDNPALAIRDYLTDDDGMRISASAIDDDAIGTFADICDELIEGVKRYRIAGTYDFSMEPRSVLNKMLAACDGDIYLTPEGKIGLMGGKYSTPDVTITSDDILDLQWETGIDPLTDFNVLKGVYTSVDHDYKETEAPQRRNEDALAIFPERTEELRVPWCPNGYQMQRLMKSYEARQRPRYKATLTTNMVGIKARFPKGDGIHTIQIDHPRLSGVFEVTSHSYSTETGLCQISVQSIYDAWSFADGELKSPSAGGFAPIIVTAIYPEGLSLSQEILTINQDTSGVQIVANVSDPGRDDLVLVAEYKRAGTADWLPMISASGSFRAVSGVVSEGDYDVRAHWASQPALTAFYPQENITVLSNPVVPDAPTNFAATASGSDVNMTWINAPENFYRTRIFRNTVDDYSGSSFVADVSGVAGQSSSYSDTPVAADTYYYWAVTLNASLVPSSPTSSQTATTT